MILSIGIRVLYIRSVRKVFSPLFVSFICETRSRTLCTTIIKWNSGPESAAMMHPYVGWNIRVIQTPKVVNENRPMNSRLRTFLLLPKGVAGARKE